MSALKRIQDFFVWLGDVGEAISPRRAPARALFAADDGVFLMRRASGRYERDRQARADDAAPLLLGEDDVLAIRFSVTGAAALHGRNAARIEAARRSPFPLESASIALTRAPNAWEEGAPWDFAAIPDTRLNAIYRRVAESGANAKGPFVLLSDRPAFLGESVAGRRAPVLIAGLIAIATAIFAVTSTEIVASSVETAAEKRLTLARAALKDAEDVAEDAAASREAALAPIRQAKAADALISSTPRAGALLIALTEATPDTAHAQRVIIRPRNVSGAFIAPDAAALARALGGSPTFVRAEVDGAARTDAATGLQRATLKLEPAGAGE